MASPPVCLNNIRQLLHKKQYCRTKEEIHELAMFLSAPKGFLSNLRMDLVEKIAQWAGYANLAPGKVLMREGELGDVMYIVLAGSCKIFKKPKDCEVQQEQPREDGETGCDFGIQTGVLSERDTVGEMCLLSAHNRRAVSAVSGENGAELITFERSTFNHLSDQARYNLEAAEILQALRASCCKRVLQIKPHLRTDDDVEDIADIIKPLEAFLSFPKDVCLKLAKSIIHVYIPPGAVLFEEDDPGDSMYVILSGQLNVRSWPLVDPSITKKNQGQLLHCPELGVAEDMHNHNNEPGHSDLISVEKNNSQADEAKQESVVPEKASSHNSEYWIGKYFLQARSTIQAQEEVSGCGNLASPLASIYASKWRQKIKDKESEDAKKEKPDKLTGMEALLGPGAAKMWRQRTFGSRNHRISQESSTLPSQTSSGNGSVSTRETTSTTSSQRPSDTGTGSQMNASAPNNRLTDDSGISLPRSSMTSTTDVEAGSSSCQDGGENQLPKASYHPNKKILSEIGQNSPTDVSKLLLAEVCDRTDLVNILQEVAGRFANTSSKRLTRKESRKLAKIMNKKLLGGPSRKGFGENGQKDNHVPLSKKIEDETDADTDGNASEWRSTFDISEPMETASVATFETCSELDEDFNPDEIVLEAGSVEAKCHRRSSHTGDVSENEMLSEESDRIKHSLDAKYGSVIRRLHAGESLGELALLHRNAKRTATITSPHPSEEEANERRTHGGAHLLRITRAQYDAAARAVQAQQFEDFLRFLRQMPPFRKLSRDKLTSLAIFCQPVKMDKGTVLVSEGDPIECVFMIQYGEIALCNRMSQSLSRFPSSSQGNGFSHSQPVANRLRKSVSMGHMNKNLLRHLISSGNLQCDEARREANAQCQKPDFTPITILGKGEIIGESVFGHEEEADIPPDQDLDACYLVRRHSATALVLKKTCLWKVSAVDLNRFGRKFQQELRKFAARRREFNQHRVKTIQAASQDLAGTHTKPHKNSQYGAARDANCAAAQKENISSSSWPRKELKPSRRQTEALNQIDSVKKEGIAWLMEDVQKLTYSARTPPSSTHNIRPDDVSFLWESGSGGGLMHTQQKALDNRHPGTPPLRPSSRARDTRSDALRLGVEASSSPKPDSTDGLLDEFTQLERAFRQKLAVKERAMNYDDSKANPVSYNLDKQHCAEDRSQGWAPSKLVHHDDDLPAAIRKVASFRA